MTKRKKRQPTRRSAHQPTGKITAAVGKALEQLEAGNYQQAHARLAQLAERFPHSKVVLGTLLEVCYEEEDWVSFVRYSEQLLPLEQGQERAQERAEILNNLIATYVQLIYPALAWEAAQIMIQEHPDWPEIDEVQAFAKSTEEFLRQDVQDLLAPLGLSPEEEMELLVQHDRLRFYTESGRMKEAIPTAEALLEKVPNFIPALNNLSLAHFITGNSEQAIAAAEQVLAQMPENFHALANLTRFYFLSGQFDPAREYATRLRQLAEGPPDLETKQAEALSFIGDDEGVRAAYRRAKGKPHALSPMLLHLAAVASYRLGNEKEARRLWREAVKQQPSFALAGESLADLDLPPGERNVPWYWPINYWFPADFRQGLEQVAGRIKRTTSDRVVEDSARTLLDKYPYLPQLFPHIFERGDRVARELVLHLSRIVHTPELARILYDFALGRYGADDQRMKAVQFVNEKYPHFLPEDKLVPMWIHGQHTDIFLMGFEIYEEGEPATDLPDDILEKFFVASGLVMEGKATEAEPLLQEVVAAAPDFPSAYNQLAAAYEIQGRRKEAHSLIEQTQARFPDYFFSRVGLARLYIQDKRVEEAKTLLEPLVRQNRLHISEFRALAQAQIELGLAQGNKEIARSWLNMWTDVDDKVDLRTWQMRIEGSDKILGNLQRLFGRSRRRKHD